MSSYRPLYQANISRSGGNLTRMMLSAHRDVMVACEPFLELFRSFRNAAVRQTGTAGQRAAFDPRSPMQDYYFTDSRIDLMDLVQRADLSLPYDEAEWDLFVERCSARCALECADLAPRMDQLRGRTYREMFDNGRRVIAENRDARGATWVGSGDSWTVEFFTPLARAYPDAKFIVLFRDPRAIINSNLAEIAKDPSWVAQPLSYLRHWRKMAAFTLHFRQVPLFKDRLFVMRHEDLVDDAEQVARDLCGFLDIDFDPAMLETDKFFDWTTGGIWPGNSSFEKKAEGFKGMRAHRWRTMLPEPIWKLAEFMCAAELRALGYPLLTDRGGVLPDADVPRYLLDSLNAPMNWRSDFGEFLQDYGFELARRQLLEMPAGAIDPALVRRSFLFEDAFEALRDGSARPLLGTARSGSLR